VSIYDVCTYEKKKKERNKGKNRERRTEGKVKRYSLKKREKPKRE